MTKSELKDIIMECLAEEGIFEEVDYTDYFEEETICSVEEGVIFKSTQGKELKNKVKGIIEENTHKSGLLKRLMHTSIIIKESDVAKCLAGVDSLFDAFHASKPVVYSGTSTNVVYCTGIKGKYLYTFTINFATQKSNLISLSFNEKNIEEKTNIPVEAIKMAIENAKKGYSIGITKNYIAIASGYDSAGAARKMNTADEATYKKILDKFPDKAYEDKDLNVVKFRK